MNLFVLSFIYYLEIDKQVQFSFNKFILSHNPQFINDWSSSRENFIHFGINVPLDFETYPFFYSMEKKESFLNNFPSNDLSSIGDTIVGSFEHLLNTLWFIKDNSINISPVYLSYIPDSHFMSHHSNVNFSNSKGKFFTETFSLTQLHEAKSLFEKIYNISNSLQLVKVTDDGDRINPATFNSISYNSHNRITRALMFLNLARSKSFIPLKISFYIAIYESLFTTNDGEISHKVSERITLYLGGTFEKRLETFRLIKEGYDIRSKFVHGQEMPKNYKNEEDFQDLSQKIDEITRQILVKIIKKDSDIFLQDNTKLNLWFNKLLLNPTIE